MDRREYSRNPDGKWAPGYHPAGRLFLAGFLQTCRKCGKDDPTLLHSRNACETGRPTQLARTKTLASLLIPDGEVCAATPEEGRLTHFDGGNLGQLPPE